MAQQSAYGIAENDTLIDLEVGQKEYIRLSRAKNGVPGVK